MYKGPQRKFKKKRGKVSEYALQLIEKQKLRKAYSLREKTLKRYFLRASKKRIDVDRALVKELETRLDNLLFRLGWAQTRTQAAQSINHGHILVNKKRVTTASYQVAKGDVIEIKESKKNIHIFSHLTQKLAKHILPQWITFSSQDKTKAQIISEPSKEDFNEPINLSLVLEYYSR